MANDPKESTVTTPGATAGTPHATEPENTGDGKKTRNREGLDDIRVALEKPLPTDPAERLPLMIAYGTIYQKMQERLDSMEIKYEEIEKLRDRAGERVRELADNLPKSDKPKG